MQSLAGAHYATFAAANAPVALTNARLASLLASEAGGSRVSLTASDLARALRHTFDLDRDRIVADSAPLLDLPTVPTGRGLRLDAAHHNPAGPLGLSRDASLSAAVNPSSSAAETFATASGIAQARELRSANHWVVLVIDARSPVSTACQDQIAALASLPRVLVLWCELDCFEPAAMARNRETLEAILAGAGLPHVGPLTGVTGEELVPIFRALKVIGKASLVMLRLRPTDAPQDGGDLPAAAAANTVRMPGSATRLEESQLSDRNDSSIQPSAIEAVLSETARRETKVVVVDLRPTVSSDLARGIERRYLPQAARDRFVWQRCIGLAAGGCRPVVLMNERQVLENATALAGLPAEVELSATVVVFAGARPLTDSQLELIADLPAVTLAAADLADFEGLLSRSLMEEGLTIINAPKRTSSPGMQLRFDSAQTFGSPDELQAERQQILGKQFSPELASWIATYEGIGQRNGYIWKWCLHGVELTTLACVRPALQGDVCDTKVLAGMLNVLVDDVADQRGQEDLLGELLKLTHHDVPRLAKFGAAERRYAEFTCEVWTEVRRRAKRYPCYDPYAALLQFDLAQLFNTVHYSHLVNSNPYILNVVEHDDYSPQGMGLLSFAMIDLMCSPEFSVTDLGRLREAMWHAQWMARIGNLMTTWQREVNDRDYTSGVFAHAISTHDLTVDQLLHESPAQITAAIARGGHEAYFLRRWRGHRAHFQRLIPEVKSVDLAVTLRGLDRLLQTELVSRGAK